MGVIEAFVLGYLVSWLTTAEPVPHVIDYEVKTALLVKYNPPDDCKEGIVDGIAKKCNNEYPRVVQTQDGFLDGMGRLIETRSELKKCSKLIELHNQDPISYKYKKFW